jgi:hypothetical protein
MLERALKLFSDNLSMGYYAYFDMNTDREFAQRRNPQVAGHHIEAGVSVWENSGDPETGVSEVKMKDLILQDNG